MDGREAMALSGSASYYTHRGISGSGSGGPGTQTGGGLNAPPGFRPLSNPSGVSVQSSGRVNSLGSAFSIEPPQANFYHGISMGTPPSGVPLGEPAKRKRGRPRKYGPDGAVSLGLSPMSATPSSGSIVPSSQKRARGRPPGSGRKQQLANLGEWMTSSAGLAFAPHVISIAPGEDIASKVLSFSQQRPRAVCILSASGAVSAVTLRQPASSSGTVTYEGRFMILCLSGSYLLAEDGGPRKRTGGLNVSLSSPEGHVIGGAVGGMLIAASPVQVVACSFVYGSSKTKNQTGSGSKVEDSGFQPGESATPASVAPIQGFTLTSAAGNWPSSRPLDLRNPHTDIDLTRG